MFRRDRREFLKMQAALLGAAAVTGVSSLAHAAEIPDVIVAKGDIAAATRAAVNALGGMAAFVQPGQRVVIKPNMSFVASVETAANTHPLVVRELLALCLEAGASSVRVLDHAFREGRQPLTSSGILPACESIAPGSCHNYTRSRQYQEFSLADAKDMKKNAAMLDVLKADVLIACPVAKSHSSTGVSLSLKGQMGLILDRGCMHGRYDLDTAIVDLAAALKPKLVVIDATRVMTTNGPYGPGRIITPGEIIASRDPVAADALTVSRYTWYGRSIQPRQVAHIAQAAARGLGRMDVDNLSVEHLKV